jgi:hypothetical protein
VIPDAACDGASLSDEPGSPFYPEGSEYRGPEYEAQSQAVVDLFCKRCPSRHLCEDRYRENPGQPGVWAGLTEAQRKDAPDTPSCQLCGRAVDPLFPTKICPPCERETRDERPAPAPS